MPDGNFGHIIQEQKQALKSVDRHLITCLKADRTEIKPPYKEKGYIGCWKIAITFSDGQAREMHVLIDKDFPYTAPRVALPGRADKCLSWPHLEKNGFLCIWNNETRIRKESPVGVLKEILGDARKLIEGNISGENDKDFKQGFLSYWRYAVDQPTRSFISLLEPNGSSRQIVIWQGKNKIVTGENEETLSKWLERWGAKKSKRGAYNFHQGVALCLPEPLVPDEYPASNQDTLKLIR